MDDIMSRLTALESSSSDMRETTARIAAHQDHLATKADVREIESSLIKWIVATSIATAGLAFVIARFIKI